MQNIRIINITVVDSNNLSVIFTHNLTKNLTIGNANIVPALDNIPVPTIQKLSVVGNTINLFCQPLTPQAQYSINFISTTNSPFISINNDAAAIEDGIANSITFLGPKDPSNPLRQTFFNFFKNQQGIYNTQDDSTLISKYINSYADNIAKALYSIRQVNNENYLTFDVVDEEKVRGEGPYDRLDEEGAYELIRLARTPSNTIVSNTFNYLNFPASPVNLKRKIITETLKPDSIDGQGIFNINSLNLNTFNTNVIKLNSVIFTLNSGPYTYDITKYGYQLKDSKYDQDFGFTYLLLNDSQFKLSDKVILDPNFKVQNVIKVDINYEYKDLGVFANIDNVDVFTNIFSTREVLPPIINIFTLKNAPIVINNSVAKSNGITFLDPNSILTNNTHPAFINEIPFSLSALPSSPGQYSVDYLTGTVYVFGADNKNDGTGPFPPLATYQYKLIYKSEIDFVLDTDSYDLVALPTGSLINQQGFIQFNYEEVLIPNSDYVANLHSETLNERINNKLVSPGVLKTNNFPITNVFRIYNETSGEIYTINRWNNDKVYFRYNNPPNILSLTNERATFLNVTNELLFINNTLVNTPSLKVIKILLKNNTLISTSEDGVGYAFNSSVNFSNNNIFKSEKWFNRNATEIININRILNVGEYIINYNSGIIYCAISSTQGNDIGTVSYKTNTIVPVNPHLISVEDIYYRISLITPKNKEFSYSSFDENMIIPTKLDNCDELFINNNLSAQYQLFNKSVGIFSTTFVPGLSNSIKSIRAIYEYNDLLNSTAPLNFSDFSTFSNNLLTVNSVSGQIFESVLFDGTNYYVNIINIPYLSTNINYAFTVTRTNDNANLWNNVGTVVPGSPLKLILPGTNSPAQGDQVIVTYTFTITNTSFVMIDYNKGELYVDYTYLADEILVSYEYGENNIDFRKTNKLSFGDTYFVSYRVGALRDALFKNFGSLINIPDLAQIDTDFDRQRYREALIAALGSFVQGPTVSAVKNIASVISHVDPQLIESAFQNWSLGNSLLYPQQIHTDGAFNLLPAKFGNGVVVDSPGQTISLPVNSNIKFSGGTIEEWLSPNWNGIDNDADLNFTITKNLLPINSTDVFIGANEAHPTIINNGFLVNKKNIVTGKPNKNKDGIFIYLDKDISSNFFRWFVNVVDGYADYDNGKLDTDGYLDGYLDGYGKLDPDGYLDGYSNNYKIILNTNGQFYDNKSIGLIKPNYLNFFTGSSGITVSVDGYGLPFINDGITFIADVEHYIFDLGNNINTNRMSLFKDPSGYLNFRIYDRTSTMHSVSADVSTWKKYDLHHVAASWKLNTINGHDEIHLFVDGTEVPNIIRYGQKLKPYLHEKYRTVNPEEILGSATRDIVGSSDLTTIQGTNSVNSLINFSALNILIGDTIFIDSVGFSSIGYTITNVNGQTLVLDSPMPITSNNLTFSINRTTFNTVTDINAYKNIAVSTISTIYSSNDLNVSAGSSTIISTGTNFNVKGILPGYLIKIDNAALNTHYTILQVNGNNLLLDSPIPLTLINANFHLYINSEIEIPGVRALRSSYSILEDINGNYNITLSNNIKANDLILIRTLGLNHRRVIKQTYIWSDGYENVMMTRLPPPISLNDVKINKIIVPKTSIPGPITSYQPSNSLIGRTLCVNISGLNVNFSSPTIVTISGNTFSGPVSETISFVNYGTLDTINLFTNINNISVTSTPINSSNPTLVLSIKEKYSMTFSESNEVVPVIKYSYLTKLGTTLYQTSGTTVADNNHTFSDLHINNYLVISSPSQAAGYYLITGVSPNRHVLTVKPLVGSSPILSFTNGNYKILNVNEYRSGLQNGYFTFENSNAIGTPYLLRKGFYEINYFSYLDIKLDPFNYTVYFGNDYSSSKPVNATLNSLKSYSIMLTDTRVGETIPNSQRSITKDFNSLKALKKDINTLMLISFNNFPFVNEADFYINYNSQNYLLSDNQVNDNFGYSVSIDNKPIIIQNAGILDSKKEATIEFWVNPTLDTRNDPQTKYLFDAFGAVIEDVVSIDNTSVKVNGNIGKILSVTLKTDTSNIDYFSGGTVDFAANNAISESKFSSSSTIVMASKQILQVLSVKIVGDFTETDYFSNGVIGPDNKTIYLGKALPSNNLQTIITYKVSESFDKTLNTQIIRLNKKLPKQNSNVTVKYLPSGIQGDRISIIKDNYGYINFNIKASNIDYAVRAPTSWVKGTWHRVKASYRVNSASNIDDLRLFIDGYEYGNILFNQINFGDGSTYGESFPGDGYGVFGDGYSILNDGYHIAKSIKFKDPINWFVIGSDYTGANNMNCLINNLRISNIFRPIYSPYGEPLDVNYSSNLQTVFPVTKDLFTTFITDFNIIPKINTDFTALVNKNSGGFDFSMNIFDSFGIISSNPKVQQILEKLIKILKPANSRVFLKYIR